MRFDACLYIFLLIFFFSSCVTTNRFTKRELKSLNKKIEQSEVFKHAFTGFAVFDPSTEQYLYESNSEKYFTPASNMKVFTYYISSEILGDSIPGFRYFISNDSLILLGTGDPGLLNSNFSDNRRALDFLKNRKEKIFLSVQNFEDTHLGKGWMWDDYPYSFQPQKSPFPIYGNVVEFSRDSIGQDLKISPRYFERSSTFDSLINNSRPRIYRSLRGNDFTYNRAASTGQLFNRKVPFDYSDELAAKLLSEAIERPIELIESKKIPEQLSVFYTTVADSLYRQLMQPSDNFVAEQLLLLCSEKLFGMMSTSKIIKAATDSLLADLPQKPILADGSGLSRYNKITPQSLILVLNKIYKTGDLKKVKQIFPTGGVNGTIKDWYPGNPPYIFAKTGTLSGVHNISGYLLTRSGKVLIFSFMHNNFTIPNRRLKKEMQTVFEWMRDNY